MIALPLGVRWQVDPADPTHIITEGPKRLRTRSQYGVADAYMGHTAEHIVLLHNAWLREAEARETGEVSKEAFEESIRTGIAPF